MQSRLEHLPEVALIHICSYLSIEDRAKLAQVSPMDSALQHAISHPQLWHYIDFPQEEITEKLIDFTFQYAGYFKSLKFSGEMHGLDIDYISQVLGKCIRLKKLDIHMNDGIFNPSFLKLMPQLEELDMSYCHNIDPDLVAYPPKLRILDMYYCDQFTVGKIFDILSPLTELYSINIERTQPINATQLAEICMHKANLRLVSATPATHDENDWVVLLRQFPKILFGHAILDLVRPSLRPLPQEEDDQI